MPVQGCLVEDDHMIQTFAAKRANHAFHESSLPRRARSRKDFLDPHGFHILPKLSSENAVAIPQQVPRDLLKGESLPQLLRGQLRRGMRGDVEVHNAPSVVSQHQEHVQDLETEGRDREEIDGHHGLEVIFQEDSPSLRRRPSMADHILTHARLPDIEA
jgi:hypothetical protein